MGAGYYYVQRIYHLYSENNILATRNLLVAIKFVFGHEDLLKLEKVICNLRESPPLVVS